MVTNSKWIIASKILPVKDKSDKKSFFEKLNVECL